MPQTKPSAINVSEKLDTESFRRELLRQLNYLINDLYSWFDAVRGLNNKSLDTLSEHDHTSQAEGGDHPWADMTASQLAYLVSLQAAIAVGNLIDKTANEEISGTYKLTSLTASRPLALNASKEIVNVIEADAETSHSITDPADTPADADALRDDLVANTIPDIESALDALGAKINSLLSP